MKLLGTQFFRNLISRIKTPHGPRIRKKARRALHSSPESLEVRIVPAAFTELGTLLKINLDQYLNNVTVAATPTGYKFTLGNYSVNGVDPQLPAARTWTGTDSANVTGNGTNTLLVTTAGVSTFTDVEIFNQFFKGVSLSGGGDIVTFADSGPNSYRANFTVTLNDPAAAFREYYPNAGKITFDGVTTFSGSAGISAFTNFQIAVNPGARVATENGNLTLKGNQSPEGMLTRYQDQPISMDGSFSGIVIAGTVQSSGTGLVTVAGRAGNKSTGDNFGVVVRQDGRISGGTAGIVSVTGDGSSGVGALTGVLLQDRATITSSGANVDVNGTGGAGTGSFSYGVSLDAGATIAAGGSGTVSVRGSGAIGTGNSHAGILNSGTITSNGGNIIVAGTGGGEVLLEDITAPGDPVQIVGGAIAFGEGPDRAIDNNPNGTSKYANSGKVGTGLTITPNAGAKVVQGLRITTGSDDPGRDPTGYRLEGADSAGGPFTLISEGPLSLSDSRSAASGVIAFANTTAYRSYRLIFTGIKNASAQAIQIGELELLAKALTTNMQDDVGVIDNGAILEIGSGTLSVTGTAGPGAGGNADGVRVNSGGSIKSTGTGAVTVAGFAGKDHVDSASRGVVVRGEISGGTGGVLKVQGDGGSSLGTLVGVLLQSGGTITSTGANVEVTGKGGDGITQYDIGVALEINTTITAGGSGSVTVMGTGGGIGNFHAGISIGGIITSNGGNITVSGTGGGSGTASDEYGVELYGSGKISENGIGILTVTGTGGTGRGANNDGVRMGAGTVIETVGTGTVTVVGRTVSDLTGDSNAVRVAGRIAGGTTGLLSVQGTALNGNGVLNGVSLKSSGVITSTGGNVEVLGKAGDGPGVSTFGVQVEESATISAGGNGTVTVKGTGGGGSNAFLHIGVGVSGTITSGGGSVNVAGTGGGAASSYSSNGVHVFGPNGQITAGGNGSIVVTGTANGMNSSTVFVALGAKITSSNGPITLSGVSGPDGSFGLANLGTISNTGSGSDVGITLVTDGLYLDPNSQISATTKAVLVQPRTPGRQIVLGTVQSGTYDVTAPGDSIFAINGNIAFNEGPDRAIDNNAQGTSKYANENKFGAGLVVTPSRGASMVTGIRITTGSDAPERDPVNYRLEGSNNPNGPFTLIAEGGLSVPDARSTPGGIVSFSNTNAYTSYRLTFTAIRNPGLANATQVGEIELLAQDNFFDVTSPGDIVATVAGQSPSNEGPEHAIDDSADKYLNDGGAGSGLLVTPAGSATVVRGLRITTGNDVPERDPTSYRLEGSNDPNGSFTLISQGPLNLSNNRGATGEILGFKNTVAYKTYRLTFPGVKGPSPVMQVAEVELFSTIPDSSSPGLYLSDAALDQITTTNLRIGTLESGPITVVSSITRPGKTDVLLASSQSVIGPNKINPAGGTVRSNADGAIADGSFVDRQGLRFSSTNPFVNDTTTGEVQVGYVPSAGVPFKPLLYLPGGAKLTTNPAGDNILTTSGKVSTFVGKTVIDIFQDIIITDDTQRIPISLKDLVGNGFSFDSEQAYITQTSLLPSLSITPNFLRLFPSGPVRVQVYAKLGYDGIGGAGVLLGGGSNRLDFTDTGIILVQDNPSSTLPVLPAGYDPNGNPTPITFTMAGLTFQTDTLTATWDRASGKPTFRGIATATFLGGSIDVEFGANGQQGIRINGTTLDFSNATITLRRLTLGGINFRLDQLNLAVDMANNKFRITGTTSSLNAGIDFGNVEFGPNANNAIVISNGSLITENSNFSGYYPDLKAIFTTNRTTLGGFVFNGSTSVVLNPATNDWAMYGLNVQFERTGSIDAISARSDTAFRATVNLARNGSNGLVLLSDGVHIVNGKLAGFQLPVQSFSLARSVNPSSVFFDRFEFSSTTDNNLLATYDPDNHLFAIRGTANVKVPTARQFYPNYTEDNQAAYVTTQAYFGAKGTSGLVLNGLDPSEDKVSFALGDINWGGTKFRAETLAVAFDPTSRQFVYSGAATWLYDNQTIPVIPAQGGNSGFPSALEGFRVIGQMKIDGLRLTTDDFYLIFTEGKELSTIPFRPSGISNATFVFDNKVDPIKTSLDVANKELFVFRNGALVKDNPGLIPRLVTTLPFVVDGINLNNASGKIDFPNTPANRTSQFSAPLGSVEFTINDVKARADASLPLMLKDGALTVTDGARFEFNEGITIGYITFAPGALVATYSTADHRYTFFGTGVFDDGFIPETVVVGSRPQTKVEITEDRGVFKLEGFDPPPQNLLFGGVLFKTSTMTRSVDPNDPNLLTFTGPTDIDVGGTRIGLNFGANGTAGLVYNRGIKQVIAFGAAATGTFTIGSAGITATGTLNYDSGRNELSLTGAATFRFTTSTGPLTIQINLGGQNTPGLVIRDAQIVSLQASVTTAFKLFGIDVNVRNLGVKYNADRQEFGLFGTITLSTPAKGGKRIFDNFAVTLGAGADSPGLVIKNGELERLDVQLNGTINLYGVTATPDRLRLVYDRSKNQLAITGGLTVSLAGKFTATAAFPGQGLLVNLSTGEVQIKGLVLRVGDVKVGNLGVRNLEFSYNVDDQGNTTSKGSCLLSLPMGIECGGSVTIVNNRLSAITFSISKTPGIAIGAPPLIYLNSIQGELTGLDDLNNFTIKATVTGTVGPSVKIFGQSRALVTISGTVYISREKFEFSGNVQLLEGTLGSGSGKITLFFQGNEVLRVEANVSLFPGGVLRGNVNFNIDRGFNITLSGNLGVYAPNGMPKIGGKSLGSLSVYLQIRPNEPRENSYASFKAKVLKIFEVGGKANFAGRIEGYVDPELIPTIKFGFNLPGAREYIASLDGDDTKSPLEVDPPTLVIDSATAVSGTPGGIILYTGTTNLPALTHIDLYVDSQTSGYQGHLIGENLPFQAGQQTFNWADLADYAEQPYDSNKPVYVYGVIYDGSNMPVFTAYSAPIVPPNYDPSISVPVQQAFGPGHPVVFSTANNNAIVITDPLAAVLPDAMVRITVSVSDGTLTLPNLTEAAALLISSGKVVKVLEDSDLLELEGRAADINTVLNGLRYDPLENAFFDDTLTVNLGRYPDYYQETIDATVPLKAHPLMADMENGYAGVSINYVQGSHPETVLNHILLHDLASGQIDGATVTIDIENYQKGHDILDLAIDDQLDLGIHATFDVDKGELTLSGFESLDYYQRALHLLTFGSTGTGTRTLTIRLGDEVNDRTEIQETVNITTVNHAPVIHAGHGLVFTTGSSPQPLNAMLAVSDPDSSQITGATVSFDPTHYVPGEDVLQFIDQNGITGSFDAELGVLNLSGVASAADYTTALQSILYGNTAGMGGTAGVRDVTVAAYDGSDINGEGSTEIRIAIESVFSALLGPILQLNQTAVQAAADESPVFVAPDATLTDNDVVQTLFGLDIAITGNFEEGDDFLRIKGLPPGIHGSYDDMTGILHLHGEAPVNYYEFAIQQVTYANHATVRDGLPRTLTFTIDDGFTTPTPQTLVVNAAAVPVVEAGFGVLVYKAGQTSAAIDPDLVVEYRGGPTLTGATVSIKSDDMVDEDQLLFTEQNGITGSFDQMTGVLTLTGTATVAQYQDALRSVQYRNTRVNPIASFREIAITVRDGDKVSAEGDFLIDVDAVLVGPVVTLETAPLTFVEGTTTPLTIAPHLTITDQDQVLEDGEGSHFLDGATVTISHNVPGEDRLTFTPQGNISGWYNSEQGELMLAGTGTFAEYQAALRSVRYINISESPSTTTRVITITLEEGATNDIAAGVPLQIVSLNNGPMRASGQIDNVTVLENSIATPLGLDDLTYSPPSQLEPTLWAIPTGLPNEALGRVLLADGSTVSLGKSYTIEELRGMEFEPAFDEIGGGYFTFDIQATDPITGNLDPAALHESLLIAISGTADTNPTERYVSQVYRDLLGRNPASADQQSWVGILNAGASRSEFVDALVASPEFKARQITEAYQQLLHRAPTQPEINQQLNLGGQLETTRTMILGSNEYVLQHLNDGVQSYVSAVYHDLLGRTATPAEVQSGANDLTNNVPPVVFVATLATAADAQQHFVDEAYGQLLRRSATIAEQIQLGAVGTYPGIDNLTRTLAASDEYYHRYASGDLPDVALRAVDAETDLYPSVGILSDSFGHQGGGTLITQEYVLTAAHLVAGRNAADFTFQLNGQTYQVDLVSVHPNYSGDLLGQEGANDIALVHLTAPVTGVTPSPLNRQAPQIGENIAFVGFGARGSQAFGMKRIGYTPLDGLTDHLVTWNFDDASESDTGPGDSGSPVYVFKNGVAYVAAVVSGGTDPNGGLGDLAYNTRVDAYIPWIESITATEANAAPIFTSLATFNQPENNANVGTVTATDTDLPSQTLTFSITGGADAGKFSITSAGVLTFKTVPDFDIAGDAGANNVYDLQVTVSDGSGGTTVQNIAVTVTAENDNAPAFISFSSINAAENQTAIGTVVATDADSPAQTVTLTITGGADAAKFNLSSAGVLTFKAAPDFESPTDAGANNVYDLQVTADDGAGQTTVRNIAVTVTNVAEGPVISLGGTTVNAHAAKKPVAVALASAPTVNLGTFNGSLAGAKLTVSITANRSSTDVLGIFAGSSTDLHLKGKNLLMGKTVIGAVSGGSGSVPSLTITFTSAATKDLIQKTLQKLAFSTKTIGTGPRTIQMQLTGLGGQDSNRATRQVSIT